MMNGSVLRYEVKQWRAALQSRTNDELAILGSDSVRQQRTPQWQKRFVPRQDSQLTSYGKYRHVVTTLHQRCSSQVSQQTSGVASPAMGHISPRLWTILFFSVHLTLSPPIPLRLYSLPYWSNPPFLIFDIWALWRSVLSARAPKCQKLKMVG